MEVPKKDKLPAFAALLNEMVVNSGLTRRQISTEVDDLYGQGGTRMSDSDLSAYLTGSRYPRLDKFAALMDVLGATQGEIYRLLHMIPRTGKSRSRIGE